LLQAVVDRAFNGRAVGLDDQFGKMIGLPLVEISGILGNVSLDVTRGRGFELPSRVLFEIMLQQQPSFADVELLGDLGRDVLGREQPFDDPFQNERAQGFRPDRLAVLTQGSLSSNVKCNTRRS
jgi:hypothetical protein